MQHASEVDLCFNPFSRAHSSFPAHRSLFPFTLRWGNITAGIDLIKREAAAAARNNAAAAASSSNSNSHSSTAAAASAVPSSDPRVFGLTLPLLTTASGAKFGKSAGNAPIWLTAPRPGDESSAASSQTSSPYQLYQYFLSTADSDVIRYLKLFTDYSLDEIAALQSSSSPQHLVRVLAESVTRLVHGESGLQQAQASTAALFGGGPASFDELARTHSFGEFLRLFEGVPQRTLPRSEILGRSLVDLAIQLGLVKTKAEGRRLIAAGGLYLNNGKVTTESRVLTESDLLVAGRICVLRSGKKHQAVLIAKH